MTLQGAPSVRSLNDSLRDLIPLLTDPEVGPEARAHVGLLHFHRGDMGRAREELTAAATLTRDPFTQNLAWLMAGITEDRRGDAAAAALAFERAVDAAPFAKASATMLASSWFMSGRREEASALLDRAFGQRPPMLDPWQRIGELMRFVPAWVSDSAAGSDDGR